MRLCASLCNWHRPHAAINHRRLLASSVFIIALSSCGVPSTTKPVDLEGFGGFKFGDNYADVTHRWSLDFFNPLTVKECESDRAFKGCSLIPDIPPPTFEVLDGIPFALGASFNRHDYLTEISLHFSRDTDDGSQAVNRKSCIVRPKFVGCNKRAIAT